MTPEHQFPLPIIDFATPGVHNGRKVSSSLVLNLAWESSISIDLGEELSLENVLALLVLLSGLVGLVIFPAYSLLAVSAIDITHNVPAGGHVSLGGLALSDVYNSVEEKRLAMLTTKVLVKRGCQSRTTEVDPYFRYNEPY